VQATVTQGAERYTVGVFPVCVLANLAALTAGTDLRTHARKVLDAINAWLESKAPVAATMEVAGRRLDHYALGDLLALRDRYRAEVYREERAAAGKGTARILMRL
jgi:acetyl-CoA carboxylase carboxyltransferase component